MHTEKVIDHMVSWLKEYVAHSGTKGFVIGISGGIDSAVTSVLCAKTGFPVLCVEMPIHQHQQQVDLAQKHVLQLKKKFQNATNIQVDLTPTFEILKESMPKMAESDLLALTHANTRARLRMTTLYYFAGLHQFLVAGTGNKIEDFGVGFYTKYGDGGVDLSPIADLLKSEVYKIAKTLDIDPEILNAAPTDGLFGDRLNDEDQLGASYDELEWAMEMVEKNKSEKDFSERKLEVFKIYTRLHRANLHKMIPIPICEIPDEFRI